MSKQTELDRILRKLADDYGKLNDKQITYAIAEIGRVRGEIAELLNEFAADDGTIKRQRLSRLQRELDGVERNLRKYGSTTMDGIVAESSSAYISGATAAVSSVVGVPLVTASIERLNANVIDYVTRRFGEDGLVLSDRVWTLSGDIRDAIGASIRSDIIRGESVSKMVKNVRAVYANETWKIKRLVVTEGNTAYRAASAISAQKSEIITYVKLNDNASRHTNHERHACYKLAREDRYGEGAGVFLPTDTEIYLPHPNCTSFITSVIDDKYL